MKECQIDKNWANLNNLTNADIDCLENISENGRK